MGEYLKGQIHLTLGLLPQERDEKLSARRFAQKAPGWHWNAKQAAKWNRVGELAQQICQAEHNAKETGLSPEEEWERLLIPGERELFQIAVDLIYGKRFEARGMSIRDLSFLREAVQLKELDLWNNDIEESIPLSFLH